MTSLGSWHQLPHQCSHCSELVKKLMPVITFYTLIGRIEYVALSQKNDYQDMINAFMSGHEKINADLNMLLPFYKDIKESVICVVLNRYIIDTLLYMSYAR